MKRSSLVCHSLFRILTILLIAGAPILARATTVATPVISLATGTYAGAQTVTITDSTSGSKIYYTTNGTAPSTSSNLYSGSITVSSSETLEAMATATGDTQSATATAVYTISGLLQVYLSGPGVQSTSVVGAATETFDALSTGTHTTAYVSTAGIGTYTGSSTQPFAIESPGEYGGALDTPTSTTTTNYLGLGGDSGSTSAVSLTLTNPVSYFGFWWSAGDKYNTVALYSGSTLYGTFTTANLLTFLNNGTGTIQANSGATYNTSAYFGNPNPVSPNDSTEPFAYISFVISGATIDTIAFSNTSKTTSFESDNHSAIFSGNTVTIPSTFVPVETMSLGTQSVSVTVTPASANVKAGGTQQFTATVVGSTNTSVTWSISPATGAGTISSSGLYTAPTTVTTPLAVTITATSVANTAVKAPVTVNLLATPTVSAWPTASGITYGQALSSSTLTGGTASVAGTFAWTTPTTVPSGGTASQSVTFTPTASTNYATVAGTVSVTVVQGTPVITFTNSNTVVYRTPLTLAATSTSGVTPTFTEANGTGSGTVSGTTFTPTAIGTVTITASVTATTNYKAGTATQTVTISAATPTVTVTSTSGAYGTPLTLTATSTYLNNGVATATGQAVTYALISGPATLSGGVLTFTGLGSVVVTGSVSATGNFGAATSAHTTITVVQGTPVITFTNSNTVVYGTPLTLAATSTSGVTPTFTEANGTGSGTVSATTFTPTAIGTVTITASVTATTNYKAGTATQIVTITPAPSYTLTASPASLIIAQGNSGTSTITVTGANGFSSSVSLSASGLPAGVTAAFAPNPTTETSVLTLTASSTATVGTSTVTVTGTSGSLTASTTIALTVIVPPCTASGYGYERAIVIDHTKVPNTDQLNFPFLFNTTDPLLASTANNGHVTNANGYDIIFTSDAAGQNMLNFEFEEYNPANGQVVAWVNVPTVSHTQDTAIYMWYGNSSINAPQQNPAGVWNSSFNAVYHLQTTSSSVSVVDSTANNNNGIAGNGGNALPTATTGVFGTGAGSFNGSQAIYLPPFSISTFTLSAWVYPTASAHTGAFFAGSNQALEARMLQDNNTLQLVKENVAGMGATSSPLNIDGWNHVVISYDGNTASFYIDGIPSGTSTSQESFASGNYFIGEAGNGENFIGSIDELRLSDSVRSGDWIATEYNNQSSPSTFYTVSNESVAIIPAPAFLYASQTQQFTATLMNTCPGAVTWSAVPSGLGVLTSNGFYTAPASITSQQAVTVTAASQANSAVSGSATVWLLPASATGPAGTLFKIAGPGFGSAEGSSSVTVGGLPAVALTWSDAQIQIQIPSGTEIGYQNVVVTVGGQVIANVIFNVTPGLVGITPSPAGNWASVAINTSGQQAPLIFNGTAGQLTSVLFSNSNFSGPCGSATATIFNPDGTTLVSTNMFDCVSTDYNHFQNPIALPTTGIYTLMIAPLPGSTGSTNFELALFNNQLGTITPGVPLPIPLAMPGQQEYLTFGGTTGQTVSMQFYNYNFNGGFANLDVTIKNPDGTPLASSSLCSRGTSCQNLSLNPTTLQQTGTYTVQLSPEQGMTGTATALLTLIGPPNPVALKVDLVPSKSLLGSPVVVDVSLTAKNGAVPTGSVTCSGPDVESFSPISSAGTGVLQLNGLPPGIDPIVCSYISSNANAFQDAVSAPVTESVVASPTAGTVSISPGSASLYGGQTQQFSASVAGIANQGVNWTISPSGSGSISASGLYSALPTIATQQTVTVTATSQANTAQSASATLTLSPPSCGSNGYSFERPIVIDHTKIPNTDQANFPVLVSGTYPFLATVANGGRLQNLYGYDVAFSSDAAGQSMLNYEIDSYSGTTGTAAYWVRVPSLSHTVDTTIFVWYGNPSINASQENRTGVWANGYDAVWHFGTPGTLSTVDSTANANNGVNHGVVPATGIVGGAGTFNGTGNTFLDIPSSASFKPATALTLEAWVNMDGPTNWPYIFSLDYAGNGSWNSPWASYILGFTGNTLEPDFGTAVSGDWTAAENSTSIFANQWNHIAGTYDGSNLNIYVNGVLLTTAPQSGPIDYGASQDLAIGTNSPYGSSYAVNGLIDEARISSVARSADWIGTEHNNQSSPSSFYALGSENSMVVSPSIANLYAGQSQQFSAATACGVDVLWSMTGAQGLLTSSGTYTAPATISAPQTVTITGTSQGTPPYSGTALVTLLPAPAHPIITLSALAQPPYVTGTTLTSAATLMTREGVPISGEPVTFTVLGANSTSGSSVTDANGIAAYTYTGAINGSDTITATATVSGEQVTSNIVSAVWIVPTQPISTSTITGAFFLTQSPYTFSLSQTPVFVQTFPSIDFDPPAGTIPGTPSGVDNNARPFTEVVTDAYGNFQSAIVAEGNGYQAGINNSVGQMEEFQVVFTGSFTVTTAGNVVFSYYDDDYFQLGIGNGATAESTSRVTLPSLTTFEQLPIIGGDDLSIQGAPPIIVYFPAPGTYPFEIDYFEADPGSSLGMVLTSSASSPVGIPQTGSLTLSPSSVSPLPVGGQQSFSVLATDATGTPVPNLGISLLVTGANEITLTGITNATGHATFNYQDVEPGTDSVQAAAFINGMFNHSDSVSVPWTLPSATSGGSGTLNIGITADSAITLQNALQLTGTATDSSLPVGINPTVTWSQISGPGTTTFSAPSQLSTTAAFSQPGTYVVQLSATDSYNSGAVPWTVVVSPNPGSDQGWVASPINGSTVTGIVPISLAPGVTLQSGGVLSYYPANNPNNPITLSSNVPTSNQIGTFDTTMLPNGSYWIQLQATDTTGNFQYSLVLVTVAGNYKPGRVTATVTDLVVPATGLAINIQRTYDSLNAATSGDFGYGWNLGINTNLTVDNSGNVTFTLAGQRRTFYLTPQSNGFLPYDDVVYTPEPGFYGTLTESGSGCSGNLDFVVPDGSLWICASGGVFTPPGYIYTDSTGTSYTMNATGNLQSIQDRTGNTLTITPGGITSANGLTGATGLSVPFVRDGTHNNRITEIDDPQGNKYVYGYDTAGNLTSVTYPTAASSDPCSGATGSNITEYAYHTELLFPYNHLYAGGTDSRGCALPTSTYFPANTHDTNNNSLTGRLESVTDSLRHTTTYSYLIADNSTGVGSTSTTTITYPQDPADGNGAVDQATMVYDAYGMLLSSTDPLGNTTSNTYDANHNLIAVIDAMGQKTTYTYDASGNKTSSTYPATGTGHNTTSTTVYNAYSEPTQTTDELGNVRLFNYDVNFNPQSVTDSIGTLSSFLFNPNQTLQAGAIGFDIAANPAQASQFTYDGNGNLASRTDALGRTTSYIYNSLGQKTSMTTPTPGALVGGSSSTTNYQYDNLGNLTQTAAPLNSTTSSTYDANGNKLTDTVAVNSTTNNTTTYHYDALGRLIETDYPSNSTTPATKTTKTYDFRNNVIDDTDQANNVTHHVYDLAGRLTSVVHGYTSSAPITTSFTYDNDGRKLTETDQATGNTTTYTYDNNGRMTSMSGPKGNFTYGYDDAGNRVSVADGKGQTTFFKYDARKRLIETDYPDDTSVKNLYDGPGNLLETINQDGRVIKYTYDAANQLKTVVQENAPSAAPFNTNSYGYDDLGNLTGLTDERGDTTQNAYNQLSELTQKTLPASTTLTETRNYDYAGNLTQLTHFDTYTTTYTYDALNRLTGRSSNSPHAEPAVSFTYTATGKYLTSTAQDGTVHYTYDALDRLITKQTQQEGTLSYHYYSTGKVESIQSSNTSGANVSYTYDDLNRLSTVVDNRLPGSNPTNYTYDNASNVATVAYPNGLTSTFSYDELNRLTGLSTPPIANYGYTLGLTGNRTGSTELNEATQATGRTLQWGYNGIYQLTNETITGDPANNGNNNGSATYTLDAVGNRTGDTSTFTGFTPVFGSYNLNDQLSGETYDSNGNVTRTANGNNYIYDSENHMISMSNSTTSISMKYDAFGNRVSKTVTNTSGTTTTQYLVEDDVNPTGYPQVLDELSGTIVARTYTYGLQLISQDRIANNALSYYQYDGGGVRQLTNSIGQVTDSYEYDAFGNSFTTQGTTPNNYLYRGEQYDSDLGLYYLRARYYNPATGRFLSRDPLDGQQIDPKTLHKYLYAGGDPANSWDPSGRESQIETINTTSELRSTTEIALEKAFRKQLPKIICTAVIAAIKYYWGKYIPIDSPDDLLEILKDTCKDLFSE